MRPPPRHGRHPPRLAALLIALLVPAPAALGASVETSTEFSVNGGSLTFAAAPALPTLAPVTLTGQPQSTFSAMSPFSVLNATGTGSGWNLTVEGQGGAGHSPVFALYCRQAHCGTAPEGYVAGGAALSADSLALSSSGATFSPQGGSTGAAPLLECAAGCYLDSPVAVKVASAPADSGEGTWLAGGFSAASLSLATPASLRAPSAGELYRVNELWTLSTGP